MSDLYGANVRLLLHMNGSSGSTVFTDSSAVKNTVSTIDSTQISTAQSRWGGSSGYFDGAGDLLQSTSDSFILGIGDFTIEMWIRIDLSGSMSWACFFEIGQDATNGVLGLVRYSNSLNPMGIRVDYYNSGWGPVLYILDTGIQQNTWHHIALTRQSNTFRFFVDGVLKGSNTFETSFTQNNLSIFSRSHFGSSIKGYVNDFRLTANVARYTADFSVPTGLFPDPDPFSGRITPFPLQRDVEDGGAYRITGTVTELGVAGSYRVRLFDRRTARCIRETWSAAEGSYSFPYIAYRPNGYFTIAYDHGDSPLNAAIADLITPEPMP